MTHRDPEPLHEYEILELVDHHQRQPDADPPRWNDALAALAEDDSLRDAALEVDPLLLFQDLPQVEVDARDVAEMKRSVRELRRSREVESALEPKRTTPRLAAGRDSSRGRGLRSWHLAAALATLLLGASLLLPSGESPETELHAVAGTMAPQPGFDEAADETRLAADQLPLVVDLDGSNELIQIESAEISVVIASLPSDFEI